AFHIPRITERHVADENMRGTVESKADEQVTDDCNESRERQQRLTEERLQEFSSHGLAQQCTHSVESAYFYNCQNRQDKQRECHQEPLYEIRQGNCEETPEHRIDDCDDTADDDPYGETHSEDHFEQDAECHELGTDVHGLEYSHDNDGDHAHHMCMILESGG